MMQGKENEAPFGFSIQAESIDAIPDVEWSTTHVGSGSTFNLLFAYSITGTATCFVWASPIGKAYVVVLHQKILSQLWRL
jgi:hypothetical protein